MKVHVALNHKCKHAQITIPLQFGCLGGLVVDDLDLQARYLFFFRRQSLCFRFCSTFFSILFFNQTPS